MSGADVTCVVPTHNRTAFLRRWLEFYRRFPPGFGVLVADSSGPEALEANRRLLARHAGAGGFRVRHEHLPLDLAAKIHAALGHVSTPYVTLCADDDVVMPDAVRRSAEFLAAHPGHVSAQGRTAKVYPARRWFGCDRLKGFSIEDDDPLVRCRRLAGNFFTNFYAVYRTRELAGMFRLAVDHTDPSAGFALAEMLLSQLSAIRGRIRVLPFLHLVLEVHPGATGVRSRGRGWQDVEARYRRFHACLVSELSAAGVEPAAAAAYVDAQYEHYRDPALLHRHRRRSPAALARHWIRSARERWEDGRDPVTVRHKRPVRSADIAGSEAEWRTALELMRRHPDGVPGEPPGAPAS